MYNDKLDANEPSLCHVGETNRHPFVDPMENKENTNLISSEITILICRFLPITGQTKTSDPDVGYWLEWDNGTIGWRRLGNECGETKREERAMRGWAAVG